MSERSSFGSTHPYERITAEIVTAIEAGAGEFRMPWHKGASVGLPKNPTTALRYHGVNIPALWSRSMMHGYDSPYWATYRQWQEIGAQVRMGEKGSPIVYYKFADGEEQVDGDETSKEHRGAVLVRIWSVFNEGQVAGWQSEAPLYIDQTLRHKLTDAFLEAVHADTRYGGKIAAYNRVGDYIRMPKRDRFFDTETRSATEAFYSVLLHEHIHWTGHASRLNRDLSGRAGDPQYALEELNAELGAAFLCGELGITVEPRADHAAYLATWLSVLKEDKMAIVKAAKAAALATDYLMKLSIAVPVAA